MLRPHLAVTGRQPRSLQAGGGAWVGTEGLRPRGAVVPWETSVSKGTSADAAPAEVRNLAPPTLWACPPLNLHWGSWSYIKDEGSRGEGRAQRGEAGTIPALSASFPTGPVTNGISSCKCSQSL